VEFTDSTPAAGRSDCGVITAGRNRLRHSPRGVQASGPVGPGYRWIVLSNTTVAMLMATLNMSSVMIAMPAIFRGIHLDPLGPGNFNYLLWMLMGYMVVTAVLVVNLGRLGDMFGRVRMYNLGFVVFTVASILLSLVWSTGPAGALELIVLRMVQALGGAMLMANTAALLTDAFPEEQRGLALGLNQVVGLAGTFVGLLAGGLLARYDWRLVFIVNVPVGIFGTVWSYWKLRELGERTIAHFDWRGNVAFAAGLTLALIGVTYGIRPYGGQTMGWENPFVLSTLCVGVALLAVFVAIERHVDEPMFHLALFRIRPFAAGNAAGLLSSIGRGGLMFMLIIWLQGIWLPEHGYSFARTPLWAGIYMIPLNVGFLAAGPVSGLLTDKFGARPFATGGMLLAAVTFAGLMALPVNFEYWLFASVIFVNGVAFGLFAAPNTTSIMNSVPARYRGVASGMRGTFQNAGMPISIAIFFSLMIIGLTSRVPHSMYAGLTANGVPPADASRLAHLPAVGYLFAAFLGTNPLHSLLGPKVLAALTPAQRAHLTGRGFFPSLISDPFKHGLVVILSFAIVMCLLAAWASWLRGAKYIHQEARAEAAPPRAKTPAAHRALHS
jgi:MFS family permease